jgi:hypothetical protein
LPLHACRMPGHIHNWAGAASLGPAAASMGHRHAGLPTASSVHNYGVLGAEQFRPPATRQVGGAANSPAPGLGPAAPPPLILGQQSGTCTCWMRHRTTAETRYPMWQLCVSGQQQQQQSSTNEREREGRVSYCCMGPASLVLRLRMVLDVGLYDTNVPQCCLHRLRDSLSQSNSRAVATRVVGRLARHVHVWKQHI